MEQVNIANILNHKQEEDSCDEKRVNK